MPNITGLPKTLTGVIVALFVASTNPCKRSIRQSASQPCPGEQCPLSFAQLRNRIPVMKNVVVTGSASGLGAAIAGRLLQQGARVIGIDRHDAEIAADLSQATGRDEAVEHALSLADGVLDGVVSCAGLGPYDESQAIMSVNYFGAVAILDGLKDALSRGHNPAAVAISSLAAAVKPMVVSECLAACLDDDEAKAREIMKEQDGNPAYITAKRALALAVRRRATEWGQLGIRLNAVGPGTMQTPMLDRLMSEEKHAAGIRSLPVPLNRVGSADAIAGTVCFLLGPDASYVHGVMLYADGGSQAFLAPDDI